MTQTTALCTQMTEHSINQTTPAAIRATNSSGPNNICNESGKKQTKQFQSGRQSRDSAQPQTRGTKRGPTGETLADSDSENSIQGRVPQPWTKRQRGPRRQKQSALHQRTLEFQPAPPMAPPTMAFRPEEVYGDGIEPKADGVFRLAYGNVDGFPTVSYNNPKANALKYWLRHIEADFFAGNESKINWSLMPRSGSLSEIFRSENALRTIAAFNTHENFSRRQYGGTFQLTFGALAARVVDTGVDERNLGRFAWTKFQGRNGHIARIVSVYVPCRTSRSSGDLTVMNQHRRYFEAKGRLDCPRTILLEDIRSSLQSWRQAGERLVVFIDANENMTKGPFHDMFTGPELHMQEAVAHRHPDPRWQHTASYQKGDSVGKWPVDGVYVTPDLPIKASSWLSFQPHLGDHRFAVLDINSNALVGDDLLRIVRPQARRLSCSVPKAVLAYNQRLSEYMHRHKVLPKLHHLYSTRDGNFTPAEREQLESLDRSRAEGMLYAEKKCRKLAMGNVDYSPEVDLAKKKRWLWQQVVKKREGRRVSAAMIKRKARQCGIQCPFSVTLAQAKEHFQAADIAYDAVKRHAPAYRHEFLCDRAANKSGNVSVEAQKAARRLLTQEKQRSEARHLKRVLAKVQGSTITRIEVLENGTYVEKTDQAEVELHTMAMCSDRFRLTENTPLRQEPMFSELGPFAVNTAAAQAILQGTYTFPADTDEYTQEFLNTIQASAPRDPRLRISCEITKEDFQKYWRKTKERTSSSISGLHFGHYKAAAANDTLSEIHALMTELAVTGASPFARWEKGLSCMLEKKAGVIKVDKLRAILLMEADFNFFNGLMFAGRMMHQAEANERIPLECYGSRKNHEAVEIAVNRRLIADILRQKRIPGAIASVDADTCYDRITHAAGSLCVQSWDVDPNAVTAMLLPIQRMKYFLRTGFGDSETFFSSLDFELAFQGSCQGNTGSPAFWLALSAFLVSMLHRQGHVAQICSALSRAIFTAAGFLFVDDTDLTTVAKDKVESPDQVITRAQEAVNAWQGGLHVSGGALKPVKSSWGLVSFFWVDGQWFYSSPASQPGTLTIPIPDGEPAIIHRYDVTEAIEVVGVTQALDGNMDAQVMALQTKAETWGKQISEGWVPRYLARKAIDSMIWPSLRYPLPACNLTEHQGNQITKTLYRQILPSLGACRNYPLVYRHAPASLNGLALPHPYVEQGIAHIGLVLTHGAIDTPTGSLLRASLEQAQLEVGIGTSFLSEPFDMYGFLLTDCLWKTIWSFISEHRISLAFGDQVLPKRQRQGDEFIMQLLVQQDTLSCSDLISCNRCRLAIEAVTLADIVTGDGKRIHGNYIGAHPSPTHRSQYEFPVEKPSPKDVECWRRGLVLLTSATYELPTHDILGPWIAIPHRDWEWFYHPADGILYRHAFQAWHCYEPTTQHTTRHRTFRCVSLVAQPPAPLARATAWVDHLGRAHFEGAMLDDNPTVPPPLTIYHLIHSWADHWPLEDSSFPDNPTSLILAIREGRAQGVCDGSYMPKLAPDLGTAAWIIEDPATQQAMEGTTQTSGEEHEVDAYRSELQGVHAMFLGLLAFCTFHKITEGGVKLGCDNSNSVRHAQGDWLKVSQSTIHADLIRAIRVIKSKLPITVTVEHLYGHQDDWLSFDALPRLAQLNVIMDHRAKTKLRTLYGQYPSPRCSASIAHEGWQCTVKGVKISSNAGKPIRRAVFGDKLCAHLTGKHMITQSAFHDIDWDAMEVATDLFPPLYRLWVSKHVSGFFGCGSMMKRWKCWENSECPCCQHACEDKTHLLTCPHEDCSDIWYQSLLGLEAWMTENETDPSICETILFTLEDRDPTQSFASFSSPRTLSAAQAQDKIGWLLTTEGKISVQWRQLQAEHYRSINSPRSPGKWAAGLITNLLSVTHSQWRHRCAVLHERDAQGIKLQEGRALREAIQNQFVLGLDGLHVRDHHYISRGHVSILALPAANQRAWLSGISIARETYSASEARELEGMRNFMLHWLAQG